LYEARFEGFGVMAAADILAAADLYNLFISLGHDVRLARDLQLIHDRVDVSQWTQSLQKVATAHQLNSEVLNEVV
jgi:hypothetical protein